MSWSSLDDDDNAEIESQAFIADFPEVQLINY